MGGSVVRDPFMENMKELIEDWDLVDIKPIRDIFTWSNKKKWKGAHYNQVGSILSLEKYFSWESTNEI
jgi:hypothetical protein